VGREIRPRELVRDPARSRDRDVGLVEDRAIELVARLVKRSADVETVSRGVLAAAVRIEIADGDQ